MADSTEALRAIHARAYDLLVFCHTVPDSTTKEIAAQATQLYPGVKVLAITEERGETLRTDYIHN